MTKHLWKFLFLTLLWFPFVFPACAQADGDILELSLRRAVDIATAPDGNVRIQLVREAIAQATARSAQARAALLPNISASVGEQNLTRNLSAFLGLEIESPFPIIQIPRLVGPYNIFDARGTVGWNILDASAIRRFQASRVGVQASAGEADAARDEVAHAVASLYFAALRAEARVEAVGADVKLAESLLTLAMNQKTAGTGTGIEVTRAQVQLAHERQLLLVAENERRQSHLRLMKTMGLKLDSEIKLTEKLAYTPFSAPPLEKAIASALEARADLKAQAKREEAARTNYSAAKMARFPSVAAVADYGSIGRGVSDALPTRAYGIAVRVPIFDGGMIEARRSESHSQYDQERVRTADLRKQLELEIRLALDSLRSSQDQVQVAEEGFRQVESELEQARRRYEAGVANSLEVTDAQTRLARARDNHIAALYLYSQARIDLGHAMGTIRQMIP